MNRKSRFLFNQKIDFFYAIFFTQIAINPAIFKKKKCLSYNLFINLTINNKTVNKFVVFEGDSVNINKLVFCNSNDTILANCTFNGTTWTWDDESVVRNQGTYKVTASLDNSNYYITSDSNSISNFTILQRKISLNWSTTTTWVYDATEHSVTVESITGLQGADESQSISTLVTVTNNTATNVGSDYVATATLSSTGNYHLEDSTGATVYSETYAFSITRRGINIQWDHTSGNVIGAYKGSNYAVSITNIPELQGTDTVESVIKVSGNTNATVGTYTATATLQSQNYEILSGGTCVYTISQRELSFRLAKEKVGYTGSALNPQLIIYYMDGENEVVVTGLTYSTSISFNNTTLSTSPVEMGTYILIYSNFSGSTINNYSFDSPVRLYYYICPAYIKETNTYYGTVEAALNAATSGQSVYVVPKANVSITTSVEVKSGVKLILPYEGETYANRTGNTNTFADASEALIAQNRVTNLTISEGVILTVKGSLCIGGVVGSEHQRLSGQTSGKYCQITMEDNSIINSDGSIDCYGYIKEASKNNGSQVNINSGTLHAPFVIYDYRGGSNTGGTFRGTQEGAPIMPFNVFDMPNIQSNLKVKSSAKYYGYVDLYTSAKTVEKLNIKASIAARHNTSTVTIVGSDGLFNLANGSEIYFKYTPAYSENDVPLTVNDSVNGRTSIQFNGNATFGSIVIEVKAADDVTYEPNNPLLIAGLQGIVESMLNTTVSTAEISFPVSWKFDITLLSGEFNIPNRMKFLTGSSLTVNPDATLNIKNDVIFYSLFEDTAANTPDIIYPHGKDAAYLMNNGRVNVTGGLAGWIKTNDDAAVLDLSTAASTQLTSYEGYGTVSGTDPVFTFTSKIIENAYGDLYAVSTDTITSKATLEKKVYVSNGAAWVSGDTQFNITYVNIFPDGQTANVTNPNPSTYQASQEISLGNPTSDNPGLGFIGWYLGDNRTEFITNLIGAELLDNITLYALWEEVTVYSVTYEYYTGTGKLTDSGISTHTPIFNVIDYEDDGETITVKALTDFSNSSKAGYTFIGWRTTKDSSGTLYYSGDSIDISLSITLYAHYNINSYTVIYDKNGGPEISAQTYSYYDSLSLPSPSRSGYTLNGFNDKSDGTGKTYSNGEKITSNLTLYPQWEKDSCLAEGTLITLADGTKKPIEELDFNDEILVFNHETGLFDSATADSIYHMNEPSRLHKVLVLNFSNNKKLRIVAEHGLFNADLNKYVYINYNNVDSYLGSKFYSINSNLEKEIVELISYEIEYQEIRVFSPVTKYHLNCFADGMLTIAPLPLGLSGIVNMFELNDDMSYNLEQMEKDLLTYGEYTYDDVKDYVSYDAYINSPIKYFKVSIGKGLMSEEEFYFLLEYYKQYS